jgi:hypothetical protein
MKRILVLVLIITVFGVKAQDTIQKPSVAKSLNSVQLGLLNLSFNNESRLARKIVLHSELGVELGFISKKYNDPAIKDESATIVFPYISLEPRWYYSLDRRHKLGRNIGGNSANYIGLQTAYWSGKMLLVNTGNFDLVSSLRIVPKYGMRRSFGKHFNYEFSGGVGYKYNLASDNCACKKSETDYDIQARIGYNFQ